MSWIQTYTGRALDIENPQPDQIDIADIAHSLGMQCRFTGHTQRFYSVAEHSVLVSENVPAEHALMALLHDASEAYLTDIARPIKPYLKGYEELEARLQKVIFEKFNLPPEIPEIVKMVDARILLDERVALLSKPPQPWDVEGLEPLGVAIRSLDPQMAGYLFRQQFKYLTRERVV